MRIKAGAQVQDDISRADIVVGVKEVPMDHLMPNKTYMFFSHTHKGQPHNLPMLQNILEKVSSVDLQMEWINHHT